MSEMLELAERVEALDGACTETDDEILRLCFGQRLICGVSSTRCAECYKAKREGCGKDMGIRHPYRFHETPPAPPKFTVSLDAAMTLVGDNLIVAFGDIAADGLPGCCICSDTSTSPPTEHWGIGAGDRAGSLARALLAAALRARHHLETSDAQG